MGVGPEVEPARGHGGLELGHPVPPIAERVDDVLEVGQEVQTDRGVPAQSLIQREVGRLPAELARLESLEFARVGMVVVATGLYALHFVDDQVRVDERQRRGGPGVGPRSDVHRNSPDRPVEDGRQRPEADRLAVVLPTGATTTDRPVDRPTRGRLRIDRLEFDSVAVAGIAGTDRVGVAGSVGTPRRGGRSVLEGPGAPGLADQRELAFGRRERFRVGVDRLEVVAVGRGNGIARADRHDLEGGLAVGVDAEQVGDGTVREAGHDLGPVVERVGDREQVRKRRPGVPERVAEGAIPVLPGVSPPRRGRDDRQRSLGDGVVPARGREDASVVALTEDVERESAGVDVVDAGREISSRFASPGVTGRVGLEVATDEIEVDVIERAGGRGGPEEQRAAAPFDLLRDPGCVVRERRGSLAVGAAIAGRIAVGRRLGDRRQRRLLWRANPIGKRDRRQARIHLVRRRFVVEVQAVATLANALRRVFRPAVVLDRTGWHAHPYHVDDEKPGRELFLAAV